MTDKNNILVTGGAGYIGSHACQALACAGYVPVTYDNLVYGHEWAVQWGPLEHGDLLDSGRLAEVPRPNGNQRVSRHSEHWSRAWSRRCMEHTFQSASPMSQGRVSSRRSTRRPAAWWP